MATKFEIGDLIWVIMESGVVCGNVRDVIDGRIYFNFGEYDGDLNLQKISSVEEDEAFKSEKEAKCAYINTLNGQLVTVMSKQILILTDRVAALEDRNSASARRSKGSKAAFNRTTE